MEIHISRNTYLVKTKKWDLNGELFYYLNVNILSIFYITFALSSFPQVQSSCIRSLITANTETKIFSILNYVNNSTKVPYFIEYFNKISEKFPKILVSISSVIKQIYCLSNRLKY